MFSDYYTILGVDPSADRATIEAALARCQPKWSGGTRNPKTKHKCQSYLDQIPAIRQALLGDATARAAYDAALAAHRRAERDRKLDDLERLVRLRAAKGGLTVADREVLRERAVKLGLTHADLDQLIELIPPKAEPPAEGDPFHPPPDVIEVAMRHQIRVTLDHLNRQDLYHALDVPRDASTDVILARADQERRRWMQKTQVTAEKTAWLEAISFAQTHLGNDQARARYDRTLALEAEQAFLDLCAFALKDLTHLDASTRGSLDEEASRLGLLPARAGRLIRYQCRQLAVALEQSPSADSGAAARRLLRCRRCSAVTAVTSSSPTINKSRCRHCKAALQWVCPICKHQHLVDEPRCSCGFQLSNAEILAQHFASAQDSYRERRYEAALDHLNRGLLLAPDHVPSRRAAEKVRERIAEVEKLRTNWGIEQARGRMVAAQAILETWCRLSPHDDPQLIAARAEVDSRIREALKLATQAREAMSTDPQRARLLFQKSLARAVDLPDAVQGLALCPPDPPRDLRAALIEDGGIRLEWTPPQSDASGPVTYRILRRGFSVPALMAEADVVGEVNTPFWEDHSVQPGESLGYAVYSRRGEIFSTQAAVAGPVLVLGEVASLRAETSSREVHLSWKAPRRSMGVRVVRRIDRSPRSPEDGASVPVLSNRALDQGLKEGQVYHYAVFCLFRTPDGGLAHSRGALISAIPHDPIPPVEKLDILHLSDGRVRLAWNPVSRGRVLVLRTAKPLSLPPGSRLSAAQAETLEGAWLEPAGVDHAIDPRPEGTGVSYYTALTSWAGSLVVGDTISYSSLPDPSDLRAVRAGDSSTVLLRWRWSPRTGLSLVQARQGAFPAGPDDPQALSFQVTESEYARRGSFALKLPPGGESPWHVAVLGLSTVNGHQYHSSGLESTSRIILPGPHPEVVVSYRFWPPRFPRRSWHVSFHTEPPEQLVPPTALVVHPRTVPLSADDGQILEHFPATKDNAIFRIKNNTKLARNRARVFVDPDADPSTLSPIRFRHPEMGATRV